MIKKLKSENYIQHLCLFAGEVQGVSWEYHFSCPINYIFIIRSKIEGMTILYIHYAHIDVVCGSEKVVKSGE